MRIARQRHAEHTVDEQRDQDRRKRQLHVGDAHDDGIDLAADITGDQAQRHPEHQRERNRGKTDQQRHARAEHDRRQHVATLVVRT
jgi:hypothetical protein